MGRSNDRHRARVRAVLSFKKRQASHSCEFCEWAPPPGLGRPAWRVLNGHHVVPVAAGGGDEDDNLTLLCPNCHAVAEAMSVVSAGAYLGPRSRPELFAQMSRALSPIDRVRDRAERFVDLYPPTPEQQAAADQYDRLHAEHDARIAHLFGMRRWLQVA